MTQKRVLLTGSSGQIGWELHRSLLGLCAIVAPSRISFNLADPSSLAANLDDIQPDLILNAGAYTAVDSAEDDPVLAMSTNAFAVEAMAKWAAAANVPVVQISTDYVFDGCKRSAYTEDDPVSPISIYGRSKAAAESALLASGCAFWNFRTSWIYSARGKNFLLTMLKTLRERIEARVVGDQFGAPTWARVVAQGVVCAISPALTDRVRLDDLFGERSVHYHLVCAGTTTWYGFATAIAEILGQRTGAAMARVLPISTSEYPTRAQRPSNSQLAGERMQEHFGFVGPEWRRALELCIDDLLLLARR